MANYKMPQETPTHLYIWTGAVGWWTYAGPAHWSENGYMYVQEDTSRPIKGGMLYIVSFFQFLEKIILYNLFHKFIYVNQLQQLLELVLAGVSV
jgi:hypothetical protein